VGNIYYKYASGTLTLTGTNNGTISAVSTYAYSGGSGITYIVNYTLTNSNNTLSLTGTASGTYTRYN
jgi:hypothetical protein